MAWATRITRHDARDASKKPVIFPAQFAGDGQVDCGAAFSKLTQQGFDGWVSPRARRSSPNALSRRVIQVAGHAFDVVAANRAANRDMPGSG